MCDKIISFRKLFCFFFYSNGICSIDITNVIELDKKQHSLALLIRLGKRTLKKNVEEATTI